MLWLDFRRVSKGIAQALALIMALSASSQAEAKKIQEGQTTGRPNVVLRERLKLVRSDLINLENSYNALNKATEALQREDLESAQDWIITAKGYLEKVKVGGEGISRPRSTGEEEVEALESKARVLKLLSEIRLRIASIRIKLKK